MKFLGLGYACTWSNPVQWQIYKYHWKILTSHASPRPNPYINYKYFVIFEWVIIDDCNNEWIVKFQLTNTEYAIGNVEGWTLYDGGPELSLWTQSLSRMVLFYATETLSWLTVLVEQDGVIVQWCLEDVYVTMALEILGFDRCGSGQYFFYTVFKNILLNNGLSVKFHKLICLRIIV